MTYEELLRSVTQALPETEGKIAIERVRLFKPARAVLDNDQSIIKITCGIVINTISPKKTIAGFVGGIVSNIVFFILICAVYLGIMTKKGVAVHMNWFTVVMLAMVTAVLGTLGDLAASTLKRQLGIKDFGNIMPGHGGLLDRFDSVLLVLPFFSAFVQATNFFEL